MEKAAKRKAPVAKVPRVSGEYSSAHVSKTSAIPPRQSGRRLKWSGYPYVGDLEHNVLIFVLQVLDALRAARITDAMDSYKLEAQIRRYFLRRTK